jgi:hypothetical protein
MLCCIHLLVKHVSELLLRQNAVSFDRMFIVQEAALARSKSMRGLKVALVKLERKLVALHKRTLKDNSNAVCCLHQMLASCQWQLSLVFIQYYKAMLPRLIPSLYHKLQKPDNNVSVSSIVYSLL